MKLVTSILFLVVSFSLSKTALRAVRQTGTVMLWQVLPEVEAGTVAETAAAARVAATAAVAKVFMLLAF